jgi:signal transduction histidine kinase/ActR/RegA family two-component response regulator
MRVGIGAYTGFVGTRARAGVGLAGTVWQTGQPLVVDDYRRWPGRLAAPSRDILRAVAGVPLKSGAEVIGVLGLAYTEEGHRFDEGAMEALNRFADLASLALDNARLHADLERELEARQRAHEDRLMLEHKLQETQKLESLGVLAGGIAHDFNNLLVSILGNVGLVLLDLEPASPVRESIEQIKIAAQRAADLTKQMLAYSGKGRFVMQPIRLNAIIAEMTQLLQVSINKNARLKFNLAENLPPFEGDATQVRQVVMNLIVNASDAIGERPGVITLTTGYVRADRTYLAQTFMAPDLPEGGYVYLEVADTGAGMDAATRARIFDPFFTTKFAGRGLGLAAVLGIVRGHRGAIKVYSEPGDGTVFRVLFPCQEVKTASGNGSGPEEERRGNGTVLVIDDEDVVRAVTKRMLERFGYTPLVAEDGQSGVQLFRAHQGEIVCTLLDMTMPRMSGEQALREIQKVTPEARVVLMSGYTEEEAISRFAGKGLSGFMQKPYTPEELEEKIHAALAAQ